MSSELTLLELPENRALFRRLFKTAYQVSEPILPIQRIMHWQTVRERLEVKTPLLDKTKTLVLGGFFYNFSTPQLSSSEVSQAIDFGKAHGVSQFLIPTVLNEIEEAPLLSLGFKKIPWFVESIFDIESDPDTDLRKRIGPKRLRELHRLKSKSDEAYSIEWVTGASLKKDPSLTRLIADLHEQNIEKYHHTVNLYPVEVIQEIIESPICENFIVFCRRERSSQKIVQVALCMKDIQRSHLFILVQGKDYSHNPTGQNLYNTLFYEIYRYGAENGLKTIYLGRGNQELKKKLGANRFRTLSNWIRVDEQANLNELHTLIRVAQQTLGLCQSGDSDERAS